MRNWNNFYVKYFVIFINNWQKNLQDHQVYKSKVQKLFLSIMRHSRLCIVITNIVSKNSSNRTSISQLVYHLTCHQWKVHWKIRRLQAATIQVCCLRQEKYLINLNLMRWVLARCNCLTICLQNVKNLIFHQQVPNRNIFSIGLLRKKCLLMVLILLLSRDKQMSSDNIITTHAILSRS